MAGMQPPRKRPGLMPMSGLAGAQSAIPGVMDYTKSPPIKPPPEGWPTGPGPVGTGAALETPGTPGAASGEIRPPDYAPSTGAGTTMSTGGLDPMPTAAPTGAPAFPQAYTPPPQTGGVKSPSGPNGPSTWTGGGAKWGPTGAEQGAFRRENYNNPLQNGRTFQAGNYQGPSANQLAHNQAAIDRHAGKAADIAARAGHNAPSQSFAEREPEQWARMQKVQAHNDAFETWLRGRGTPMPGVGQGSDLLKQFYSEQPQWAPQQGSGNFGGRGV